MSTYKLRIFLKYGFIFVFISVVDFCGLLNHIFELNYEQVYQYSNHRESLHLRHQISGECNVGLKSIFNYSIYLNPYKKIKEREIHLTLLIKSAIENVKNREAIRRTWGLEQRFSDISVKRVFIIGSSSNKEQMKLIHSEYLKNGDILQINFLDTYLNNTIKTVQAMKWAVKYCQDSSFFMFIDDDYYVSIKNVIRFIAYQNSYPKNYSTKDKFDGQINKLSFDNTKSGLYAGFVIKSKPHRHKFSKWFVSLKDYPFNKWPPYITAGAFLLSRDVLFELYEVSLDTQFFKFDDVFLGIVAQKAKILLTHCDMFYFEKLVYSGPKSYQFVVASHGFHNSLELIKVWNECRSDGYA